MSKFIRVTHTYLVPMPDDLPDDDPSMEMTVNRGVSMMEDHMLKLYQDPRRCVELNSSWKIVSEEEAKSLTNRLGPDFERGDYSYTRGRTPRRLPQNPDEQDRITSLKIIEGDFDRGVSFAQDVMGQGAAKVPHPWDQGMYIFPHGHSLRALEEEYRKKYVESGGKSEISEAFKRELEGGK